MAARFKVWVCGHSLAGIAGSNLGGGTDVSPLWVLRVCQLEVFASESSLVDRYTESESGYDHKTSTPHC